MGTLIYNLKYCDEKISSGENLRVFGNQRLATNSDSLVSCKQTTARLKDWSNSLLDI